MTTLETTSTIASASQRRLTLLHHLNPHDPGSNVVVASDLGAGLDPERLADAVRRVLAVTPSFNETFALDNDAHVVRTLRTDTDHQVPVRTYPSVEALQAEAARRVDTPVDPASWPLAGFEVAVIGSRAYLLVVASHIVSDGFGFYLLLEDIAGAYADGPAWIRPHHLSPADIDPPTIDTDSAVEHFRSVLPRASLAIAQWDAGRDAVGRTPGSTSRWSIDTPTAHAAAAAKDELQVRRFSHLLAAFVLTVHAITGEDHLCVSIPLSNRRAGPEHAATRGALVNTLPISVRISRHRTYAELCREVDRQVNVLTTIESFDFAAHRPLLDITAADVPSASFTFYPAPLTPTIAGSEPAAPVGIDRRFLQYPLAVVAEKDGNTLNLIIEQSDLLADLSVGDLYETVLHQTSTDPHIALSEISWVAAGSRNESVLEPTAEPSAPTSITQLWQAALEANADVIALEHADEHSTFVELDYAAVERARAIAAAIPGDLVGIAIAPSTDLIVTILAVLLAGKAYVPLDVSAPAQRVSTIVDTCGSLDVIVAGTAPWELPNLRPHALDTLDAQRADIELPPVAPNDSAYVIFTSGSTGRPKGVGIDHHAVTRLISTTAARLDLAHKRWTLYHSYAFDFSVWEIFGALLNGGTLVIPDASTRQDPHRFLNFLADEKITVLNQTPSAFSMLTAAATDSQIRDLAVETVIFGGEALYFDQLRRFHDLRESATTLVNMYGITETTVHATWFVVDESMFADPRSVIGAPLDDLGIAVVDAHHRPVPVGVVGELAVFGPGVTQGYLKQPELTSQRVTTVAGRPRTYLSGDLAYLDRNKQLVYIGRRDKQVQLRGHRIELGEVEWALRQLPGVEQSVVITAGSGLDAELIGFVVTTHDPTDTAAVRRHIADHVPSYMIPARIIAIDAIPITINGKIDRDRLSAHDRQQQPLDPSPKPTGSGYQHARDAIRRAWETSLNGNDFADGTPFFDAGGTSVMAVAILHRLRTALDFPGLDIVDLFEHTTVHALATFITDEQDAQR